MGDVVDAALNLSVYDSPREMCIRDSTIGGLTASDFVVYPDFSSVRDSGEKNLRLLVRGAKGLLNGVTVTMEGNDLSLIHI